MNSNLLDNKNKIGFEKVIIILIILSGIFISAFQFFYNRSLWLDEAMLAVNIISKNPIALLHPLDYNQIAPILFLQIEKIFSILIPDSELGLRLFPLLSFWISLFFFYKIIKILFQQNAVIIFALSVFVFNTTLLYFSSEVKQYMTDLMAIVLFYYLLLRNYKKPEYKYYVLVITGIISIFLSNIAPVFLLSGGLYLLFYNYKNYNKKINFLLFGIFSIWLTTFTFYYFLFTNNHPSKDFMLNYWEGVNAFMPINPLKYEFYQFLWNKIIMILFFLFKINSLVNLCIGICILTGILFIIFKKELSLIILLLIPLLLHLLLSAFKLYPFDLRLILYLCPLIIITATIGFKFLLEKYQNRFKYGFSKIVALGFPVIFFIILCQHLPLLRSEIKESIINLNKESKIGDKLYVYYAANASFIYYNRINLIQNRFTETITGTDNWDESNNFLNDFDELKGRTWLLFSNIYKDDESRVINRLNENGHKVYSVFKSYRSSLYLYDFK